MADDVDFTGVILWESDMAIRFRGRTWGKMSLFPSPPGARWLLFMGRLWRGIETVR